ncbi:MAG: carbamoyl-phosphate synthase subunit [Anaerophaga sp.]|nr:carbamoyl-phosphate synthase subunit [Anaerophaga sp.]
MSNRNINKIFIANRGEIACRIIRTASRLGISTIIPLTKEEKDTLPADAADEVHILESSLLNETYLNAKLMVDLAKKYEADAIHPGYGFLSENADFARLVEKSGLIWIGPEAEAIAAMGDKLTARTIASEAGISMTRALSGGKNEILKNHESLKFPLLIKAAAGGGGKAMKIARNTNELKILLDDAAREAQSYFGNPTIFVEEYIENPRHIEVQILGDQSGKIVHLYERECSIQRRYQKIIEESPSSFVDETLREKLVTDALKLGRKIGYYNAGTVEFLVDTHGKHYFLEMNTRLQVEHPVTEFITGIDLVEEQIKVAMGLPLAFSQEDVKTRGHAIEARIYAEDALADFKPSPGEINLVHWPDSKMARTDTFFASTTEIQPWFDPMLAKITTWGLTREAAIQQLLKSLKNTSVIGIPTNLPYLRELIKTDAFINGDTTTHFTSTHKNQLIEAIHPNGSEKTKLLLAAYSVWLKYYRNSKSNSIWTKLGHKRWGDNYEVTAGGEKYLVGIASREHLDYIEWTLNGNPMDAIRHIHFSQNSMRFLFQRNWFQMAWNVTHTGELLLETDGHTYRLTPGFYLNPDLKFKQTNSENSNEIKAPIPGRISRIFIPEGEKVAKNTPLVVIEAMKMENILNAPTDGTVKTWRIKEGDQVKAGQILTDIEELTKEIETKTT